MVMGDLVSNGGQSIDEMVLNGMGALVSSDGRSIDEILPQDTLIEILSRLADVRDLASCAAVNNVFRLNSTKVKALRFLFFVGDFRGCGKLFESIIIGALRQLSSSLECLHLQLKHVEAKIKNTNFSFIQRDFILKWLQPPMITMLQDLTIIEYGNHFWHCNPKLLTLLSINCKHLRKLELQSMSLEFTNVEKMNQMTTLILRLVDLTNTSLQDVNESMPQLDTMILHSIVGLQEAHFTSNNIKEFDMILSTTPKSFRLNASHLIRLRLKMAYPLETCVVDAPELQYLAISMDNANTSATVQFENITRLKELELSSSQFPALASLSSSNLSLEKLVLEVSCSRHITGGIMVIDFHFPPSLQHIIDVVQSCCPNLRTLSIGRGLWQCLGESLECESSRSASHNLFLNWPPLTHLKIPMFMVREDRDIDFTTSMALMENLVKAIPTVITIEGYGFNSGNIEDHPLDNTGKIEDHPFDNLDNIVEIDKLLLQNYTIRFPQLEIKCDKRLSIKAWDNYWGFFVFYRDCRTHLDQIVLRRRLKRLRREHRHRRLLERFHLQRLHRLGQI